MHRVCVAAEERKAALNNNDCWGFGSTDVCGAQSLRPHHACSGDDLTGMDST
jgi:hypothetical protein